MIGRILLSVSAVGQILGPFIADFNETHVKNPNWPGHARFHNGQTMSMGLALGLSTLYYTWRKIPGASNQGGSKRDDLFTAALMGSLYWITGISAILYPGSLGVDKEFGEGFPQRYIFSFFAGCAWIGLWVETRGLGKLKSL